MAMPDIQKAPIVALGCDYTITLPAEIAQRFLPTDRFLVWLQGDMLLLKRVTIPNVTTVVETTPPAQPPLTLEEIDDIVHQARKSPAEA